MLFRSLRAEFFDFYSRPLEWLSILVVSLAILVGVDQLALDQGVVKVLIVDSSADHSEGNRISDLIMELSDIRAELSDADLTLDQAVANSQADIILHKVNTLWRATLRPRSILDHRRLARTAFSLAEVINHLGPWDTVISADSMSRRDYQKMVCDIGERVCSVLKSVGYPGYTNVCLPRASSEGKTARTDDGGDDGDEDGGTPSDSMNSIVGCSTATGPVLMNARSLAGSLQAFCDAERIDKDRAKGICTSPDAPTLGSVVSIIASPQSHTKVFVSRTICLLSVFLAFVLACRSWIQDVKYNTWQVIAALSHGSIRTLLAAKVATVTLFIVLLTAVLLEFSSWQFGISIKPGIYISLLLVLLAALSSAMLGLSVALFLRSESSAYIAASLYLLILIVLSGYIDELKQSGSIVATAAYALPLKYLLSPFEAWMTFGIFSRLQENIVPLMSQCTVAFSVLLLAKQIHRRRS